MGTNSDKIELSVIIALRVRYHVFDLSGALPFEFCYSLARGWPIAADNVPEPLPSRYVDRALKIRVQDSILDVAYALKYGHIKVLDEENEREPIDFSDIETEQSYNSEYVTLESGAGSLVRWKKRLHEFSTRIYPSGSIGRKFHLNRQYRLVVPRDSDDFPVQNFILEGTPNISNDNSSIQGTISQQGPSETLALRKVVKSSGHNQFIALPSVHQPPQVSVQLSTEPENPSLSNGTSFKLRAEIINKSDRAIIVKSIGNQNYLAPQPYLRPSTDNRPRITCLRTTGGEMQHPLSFPADIHWSNLSITKLPAGEEICREYVETCSVPVGRSRGNRSKLIYREQFTTLEPNVPLIKENSLARIYPRSAQLEPGKYRLNLFPLGAVWFWGSTEDVFGQDDSIEQYPWPPSQTLLIVFASEDEIVFSVE